MKVAVLVDPLVVRSDVDREVVNAVVDNEEVKAVVDIEVVKAVVVLLVSGKTVVDSVVVDTGSDGFVLLRVRDCKADEVARRA